MTLDGDTGDLRHDVHELVDAHELTAAEVDRVLDAAVQDRLGAVDAVVDVHEAAGLLPVAPDLDLVVAAHLGLGNLAADCRRGLLPAPVVGPVRAIHVVVAGDPGVEPEVLAEVTTHPFAEQLLPPVAILGLGRIGIGFAERGHVGESCLPAAYTQADEA